MLSFHDKIYYIQLSQTWRRFNESKNENWSICIFHLKFFFSFVTFCFFFKNWTKKSLYFIYPPPIFLKNLSDNKDILYLFFSINMCKNILMKKMYLCLLNIRHTKKKEGKKACLSHCLLHEHSALDDFEPPWTWMPLKKKKTKIHDAFQLLIECPKVWRTWIRENIAASPYYVL